MHSITRREFLRLGAGAAVALAAPPILSACGGGGATSEPSAPGSSTAAPQPSARVAAIRGEDLYAMARDALDAVGGAGSIVHSGETVFIKPNMVMLPFAPSIGSRSQAGDCAKPEIVIAVAEECLRAGAREVIIGDGAQMSSFDWSYATTLDGSTDLAREANRLSSEYEGTVRLACLDSDSPGWVEVPTSAAMGKIAISSLVAEADRVISIPVVKTHQWAQLSLSLKNFVGVTPLERYGWRGADTMWSRVSLDHSSPASIAQIYLDIVDALRPDLAIIDASLGVEGNGPSAVEGEGITVDMRDRLGSWLLLASTDLVAADATAARIMSHDVADVEQLGMAYERGLGEMREDRIEIVGEKLDDLRVDWTPAELANFSPAQSRHYGPGEARRASVG
jgi:uncharacterized protein (DUF362 family)